MRYSRYLVFFSALMVAASIFMPFVQLGVGGVSFGDRTTMPLFNAVQNYGVVEKLATDADISTAEKIADAILVKAGKAPSQLRSRLDELRGVIRDAKAVQEEGQLNLIGKALRISSYVFLLLLFGICVLILKALSDTSFPQRRRHIIVMLLAGLVAAIGIVLFFAVREALPLANEELGAPLLSFGSGAYMLLAGCILMFGGAVAIQIIEGRAMKKSD